MLNFNQTTNKADNEVIINGFSFGFLTDKDTERLVSIIKGMQNGTEIKAKKLIDAGYEGKTVVLGIRPEDIKDEEMFISNSPESVVEVTVRVYELLGAEVFLYLDVDNYEITARDNPRTTARPGDQIKVAMDLSKLHIFDKETEQVITH